MNFINRAFKNVTRKMSKSILLTLTFFLIGNLVIIKIVQLILCAFYGFPDRQKNLRC